MNEIGLQPVDCRLRYSGGRWPIKFDYIDPCVDQIVLEAELPPGEHQITLSKSQIRSSPAPIPQVKGQIFHPNRSFFPNRFAFQGSYWYCYMQLSTVDPSSFDGFRVVFVSDLSRTAESPTRCRFRTRNPEDPVQVLGFLTD
ncbi:hypothetical protein ACFX2I_042869 [Malus domestica]